jgi:hypothetical protein
MNALIIVGSLLFWACVAAIVYPYGPFSTRRGAALTAAAILLLTAALMPALQKTSDAEKSSLAGTPVVDGRKLEEQTALWQASRATIACRTMRSAEAFALLDAVHASSALTNPQSDASQTDCRHVKAGAQLYWGGRRPSAAIDEVWIDGIGPFYMLSKDVVPARVKSTTQ